MNAQIVGAFIMTVSEVFRLSDGTTIFAGEVPGATGPIAPCRVEVLRNGIHLTDVDLRGERLGGPKVPPNHRIVYAVAQVDIDPKIPASELRLVHRKE